MWRVTFVRVVILAVLILAPAGTVLAQVYGMFAWEAEAPSPLARFEAQGVVAGGKLYVFGGFYESNPTLATTRSDAYDRTTDTWERLAEVPEALTHSPAVVDGDTVYLLGGYVGDHPGGSTDRVWKYDTAADAWSAGPPLPEHRGAGAAAIVGRTIHFFGGAQRAPGSTRTVDKADHWMLDLGSPDPAWEPRAPMPNPRNHVAGATLGGKVYAIGGQRRNDEANGNQSEVDVYDPATDTWTAVADLPTPRSHVTSSAFPLNGLLMVLGGSVNDPLRTTGRAVADVTAYDPKTNVWVRLPPLPDARKTPVADAIGDAVGVSTGNGRGGPTDTTWTGVFSRKWESGPGMPVALGETSGGILGRKAYLTGEGDPATLAYDLSEGRWSGPSSLATRPYPQGRHAAEVFGGKLYLFGGSGEAAGKVQVYDPATDAWHLGAQMPFAAGSSVSAVVDGRIYVAGGIVGSSATDRAARYDPATDEWTPIAPMAHGRGRAAAGTDGEKVYVFGGHDGEGDLSEAHDTVQVYDPAADTWASSSDEGSRVAPMPQARGGMGRAVYYEGEFYVVGGETRTGTAEGSLSDRVDVYDPATKTWRPGPLMPTARSGTYPLLIAGRIHVAGGDLAGGSSSSVLEVYNAASDATAPDPPSLDLAARSDSGDSGTDDLTNDATPTFEGTAEPRSKVGVYDAVSLLGHSTANGAGGWSFTVAEAAGLGDGEHRISAKAADGGGNTSAGSDEVILTVDTVAPDPPTIEAPAADGTTSTADFTVSGRAEAKSTVELFEADASKGEVVAGDAGEWSVALIAVADGPHIYVADATDSAGNTSVASGPLTTTVDTRGDAVLSLAASPRTVDYGGTTALSGRLLDSSTGKPLSGEGIALWRSTDNGVTWSADGTASSDASGTFEVARSLSENTDFQVRFAGNGSHRRATAPKVTVGSRAWLSRPVTPDRVREDRSFAVYGYLKPYHAGSTLLYFHRYHAGRGEWVFYDSVEAANIEHDGHTKYALRYELPTAGKWAVRAYHADASHATTRSPVRIFYAR